MAFSFSKWFKGGDKSPQIILIDDSVDGHEHPALAVYNVNESAAGGDASAVNQTAGNASLASIDTKTPALGQGLAAASTPVVLTAIQVAALTPSKAAGASDAGTTRTVAASDSPEVSVLGATSGAAVVTDANGTIQQYLRGIVVTLISFISAGIKLLAGENHIGEVGGRTRLITTNFTRVADTNVYASGDLIANNVTAASVVVMTFANASRITAGSGSIRRAKLKKSGTSITNASFRLHLYAAAPGLPTNGDNGAWLTAESSYLGAFDFSLDKVFTDASEGFGMPSVGNEINFQLASGSSIFGYLEARAAYTPISAEVFTPTLEIYQD